MISFDLKCHKGHIFEGWFDDNDSFEKQKKEGLLTCPVCESKAIFKLPSTFGIKKTARVNPISSDNMPALSPDNIKKVAKELTDFIDKNFEDVGSDFTKEALKIHYGISEPKNIKGVSTKQEEKLLTDEGIKFSKIPVIPENFENQ